MVKSTKKAISENDGSYFHNKMFPKNTSLGELQVEKKEREIRKILCDDIADKYDLGKNKIGYGLHHFSLDVLRELLIFGKHMHIVDEIRIKTTGSF
jgi:hypothetical protein